MEKFLFLILIQCKKTKRGHASLVITKAWVSDSISIQTNEEFVYLTTGLYKLGH